MTNNTQEITSDVVNTHKIAIENLKDKRCDLNMRVDRIDDQIFDLELFETLGEKIEDLKMMKDGYTHEIQRIQGTIDRTYQAIGKLV